MAEDNHYYIPAPPGGMACIGYLCECRKCHRRIIVDMGLFGTVHNTEPMVCCADCMEIDPKFREQFPDISSRIDSWKTSASTPAAKSN